MKKGIYIILSLAIIVSGVFIFMHFNSNSQSNAEDDNISEKETMTPVPEETPEQLVSEIISLSKEGKIIDFPYQAGISELTEINEALGEPSITDESILGNYATYSNEVTIGFQDNLSFDLRSYDKRLQQIHLSNIKKVQGEPTEIKYYKDDTTDQIILIYQVNSTYQLKWILPNPTELNSDPVVHHISIYTEPPVSAEILTLLKEMSLEEKIGQMIFAGVDGTTFDSHALILIHDYKVGGIIFNKKNFSSAEQTIQYLNKIRNENTSNKIPLFLGVDQEGGIVAKLPGNLTPIPTNLEIGKVNNTDFSNSIGQLLGKEVKAYGFNMNFAPVLDINSNPNNPVIGNRSFGNSADLVSRLGIATMKGIQSENIIAVVKHFPGHGDTSTDSHLELPRVNKSLEELQQLELLPFQQAITEGADVVMIAHILLPNIDSTNPSSMSKVVISDILRNQLQYDGVVITDDMTMEAIIDNFDIGDASVQSVKAGSDIVMVAHGFENAADIFESLKTAVENGELSEERIDESIIRILQLKEKYQLKDEQIQSFNINTLNEQIKGVLNEFNG